MNQLSYQQMKELVEVATAKGFYDYCSIIVPNIVTLAAVGISYFFYKNHSVQIASERVIEKDVEKLYEAADSFFIYSDSVQLYFSMKEKKIDRIINNIADNGDFDNKFNASSDSVFDNFSHIHKASFLLRALGQFGVAKDIDNYREATIKLRKDSYFLVKDYETNNDVTGLQNFKTTLNSTRRALESERDKCLSSIAECKEKIIRAFSSAPQPRSKIGRGVMAIKKWLFS